MVLTDSSEMWKSRQRQCWTWIRKVAPL